VADPRYQLDDHEGQDDDRRAGEDIGKTLALTERRAGVSNKAKCQHPAQQADLGQRLEVGHSDDLGDKISGQPDYGNQNDEKPQASPFDPACAAD
jgi:hypothetical protein